MNLKIHPKYLLIGLLAVTLSACGTTSTESASATGSQSASSGSSSGPAVSSTSQDGVASSIAPGSAEDLEVNVGDRVFFDFDAYNLTQGAQTILRRQAQWLRQYPALKIIIEGHADERGTREYNMALGDRRANAVQQFLIGLGIAADRISTVSYGKERPAVVGSGESVWSKNRRGVTRVM
ncbi:MAG: peptidoglycan-associated lipoprotein Pal [Pseudomonadota bacterium]